MSLSRREFILKTGAAVTIAGENPVQGYKNNQEQITHIHFKDFSPDGRLCIPGQGIIDFPNLIKEIPKRQVATYLQNGLCTGGYFSAIEL